MQSPKSILDINDVHDVEARVFDYCIVGSGPAGVVLATELASHGASICVLESGSLEPSEFADALRETITPHLPIKIYSRERLVGGTSLTWHGLSAPLDPVEFAARPCIDVPGWPISRSELLKYWRLASERYGFPSLEELRGEGWIGAVREQGDLKPAWRHMTEKLFVATTPAQRFGDSCISTFESGQARLLTNATVVRLEHHWDEKLQLRVVAGAIVKTSQGRKIRVSAKRFVLAAGGIEVPRLLLASRSEEGVVLGNHGDCVGRYFMNHPKNDYGIIHLRKPLRYAPYFFGFLQNGKSVYCGLRVPEEEQARLGVLNSYVRFEPLYPWSDNAGVEALITIVKHMKRFFAWWRERRKNRLTSLRSYAETGDDSEVQNSKKRLRDWLKLYLVLAVNFRAVVLYLHARLRSGYNPKIKQIRVRYFMEMEPRPENRITLSSNLDSLGVPFPVVDYSCSELDKRSVLELEKALRKELVEQGLGELRSDIAGEVSWPINLEASHHLGATRMGTSPENSVVDENLRVHGVENLFIVGGSVFPVSGCANPTYTICALSIRLAEHLRFFR